jgi:hypothetical protein
VSVAESVLASAPLFLAPSSDGGHPRTHTHIRHAHRQESRQNKRPLHPSKCESRCECESVSVSARAHVCVRVFARVRVCMFACGRVELSCVRLGVFTRLCVCGRAQKHSSILFTAFCFE